MNLELPKIEGYIPRYKNLAEITANYNKLSPEELVIELANLRFKLGYSTTDLFDEMKKSKLDPKSKADFMGVMAIACYSNDPDVFKAANIHRTTFDIKTIETLYKLAVNYYKNNAQSQN